MTGSLITRAIDLGQLFWYPTAKTHLDSFQTKNKKMHSHALCLKELVLNNIKWKRKRKRKTTDSFQRKEMDKKTGLHQSKLSYKNKIK